MNFKNKKAEGKNKLNKRSDYSGRLYTDRGYCFIKTLYISSATSFEGNVQRSISNCRNVGYSLPNCSYGTKNLITNYLLKKRPGGDD
jgi:hypothetical protein